MPYLVRFHWQLFSLAAYSSSSPESETGSICSNLSTSWQRIRTNHPHMWLRIQNTQYIHMYAVYGWWVSFCVFVCLTIHPYSMHTVGYSAHCLHTIRYKSKSAASGNALESGLNSVPFPVRTFVPIPIPIAIPDSVSDRTFAYRLSGVLTRQEKGRTWA